MAEPAPLTEAEAAVYDRQIRVWGVDTQQRCALQVTFVQCRVLIGFVRVLNVATVLVGLKVRPRMKLVSLSHLPVVIV